ncbi:MAG: hypothetical protein WC481_01830 [Candidatus Omnitrophota bacterium]
MFTKEDYTGYFRDINAKEKGMAARQKEMLPRLKDKVLIANIENVLGDEVRHVGLTEELLGLLDRL